MHVEVAGLLLGIGDAEFDALARKRAGIADLAARLRIERRLVQNDAAAVARFQGIDFLAVLHQGGDSALGTFSLVTEKLARTELFVQRKPYILGCGVSASGPRRARLLALAVHRV